MSFGVAPLSQASTKEAVPSLTTIEKQLKSLERPPSSNVSLTEAGSSLFEPLFAEWASSPPWPTISLNPAAGGSGAGVTDATTGLVNIGASDPYLTPAQTASGLLNIPVVVAGQAVNYYLPGLPTSVHLRLNSTVLAGIYSGSIKQWNAPQIKKINPGVKIPGTPIVTIHRSDSSGDTNLFTTYISDGDPSSFVPAAGGPANTISWPNAPGALAANGNAGMLATLKTTPGGIAYIGLSYLRQAQQAGLGYALLQNGDGNYVGPTTVNMDHEVAAYTTIPSTGAVSLEYSKAKAAAAGYPDVNFEYAIVKPDQPNATTAAAIKAFLAWGMDPKGGASSKYLTSLYFQPMPANALAVAVNLLNRIS